MNERNSSFAADFQCLKLCKMKETSSEKRQENYSLEFDIVYIFSFNYLFVMTIFSVG